MWKRPCHRCSLRPCSRLICCVYAKADGVGEGVAVRRDDDQRRAAGHQAVAEHLDTGRGAAVVQRIQIRRAVIGREEHVLPIVAALRYMVQHIWNDDASGPWYDEQRTTRPLATSRNGWLWGC